jgi:hypothetical protein
MVKDLTPQKDDDDFHMMIGYCVAEWANVDDELFRIFHNCVGPLEQSAIIYYRTPTLNARLGFTDEIVQSVLPKRPKKSGGHYHLSVKAWKDAIQGFCKLLGTRRRIAHQPISVRHGPSWPLSLDLSWILGPPSWFEIYVGQHEQLRSGGDLPPLKVDDLKEHLTDVAALRIRLQQVRCQSVQL